MASEPVARVSVLSSGKLLLDGKPTTLTALDSALATIKASRGVVWYYRETAEAAEPPAISTQVIELVIKHRLPISMSTKPDFSDAVGADGRRESPDKSLERDLRDREPTKKRGLRETPPAAAS